MAARTSDQLYHDGLARFRVSLNSGGSAQQPTHAVVRYVSPLSRLSGCMINNLVLEVIVRCVALQAPQAPPRCPIRTGKLTAPKRSLRAALLQQEKERVR